MRTSDETSTQMPAMKKYMVSVSSIPTPVVDCPTALGHLSDAIGFLETRAINMRSGCCSDLQFEVQQKLCLVSEAVKNQDEEVSRIQCSWPILADTLKAAAKIFPKNTNILDAVVLAGDQVTKMEKAHVLQKVHTALKACIVDGNLQQASLDELAALVLQAEGGVIEGEEFKTDVGSLVEFVANKWPTAFESPGVVVKTVLSVVLLLPDAEGSGWISTMHMIESLHKFSLTNQELQKFTRGEDEQIGEWPGCLAKQPVRDSMVAMLSAKAQCDKMMSDYPDLRFLMFSSNDVLSVLWDADNESANRAIEGCEGFAISLLEECLSKYEDDAAGKSGGNWFDGHEDADIDILCTVASDTFMSTGRDYMTSADLLKAEKKATRTTTSTITTRLG